MSFEQARSAIYTRMKLAWEAVYASVPVQYENRLGINFLSQRLPFVGIEVSFDGAEQASIEINPMHRYYGVIHLAVFVLAHEGVALQNTYLKFLADVFRSKTFGGVNTRSAVPVPAEEFDGWWRKNLRVEFWFDDQP